ncbi:zinc finger protein Xfin-like isoform X2 [Solea senegalensis]|uniref:Zinc finger protein Xfin-like isoform X2 n=1 Tax=Solea senegalensis TaxID=28829 RepID=A0AAV6Q756_SOLSE|nr:zinc finger protein with KRAB and SCAN domains 8-like isoform X1 [Solea senegalensis]KAG7485729.1 zinc finger protein Xfin-like isoform X2 [Solea senegalensis]
MSHLDSLLVTFQTQLSDVMETVVKTAMYEVTRLVEEGFLEEVKRRGQEVESLMMRLQWTEKKLSDHEAKHGENTGRCVDCTKRDVKLCTAPAGERSNDQQDVLRGCGVKEDDSTERWTRSHRQEVIAVSEPQEEEDPSQIPSPERQTQVCPLQAAEEKEDVVTVVDVKEEVVNKPSCSSVHLGGWSSTLDGKVGIESQSTPELTEMQLKPSHENSEEVLRNMMKQSPPISPGFGFPEEMEDTRMPAELSDVSSLEMDTGWSGLLQNHTLGPEDDHDSGNMTGSLKCTEHELSESVLSHVHAQVTPDRDQNSTSGTSTTSLGVTIKQEVIADSDGCEEGECMKKKEMPKSSISCSVKQHRPNSAAHKHKHISHKGTVQEVMKLHPKTTAGLKLQAAIQHLHRPMRKNPQTLSNNTTVALSRAHSQVMNPNPLNRCPSTSKSSLPPPLSAQRVHLSDKQAAALSRTAAPWVGNRSQHQSANSQHVDHILHPDSHAGPRHALRCGQCGKCFPHPSNLKAHLQTHTGERPFCCSLCGRSFTKLSNLKAHRRVHTGERPYCCLACGKRFTQKCNLKRHQRIHLDV